MFEPAERLKSVKVSASSAMTRKVRELRAQGVKIVGLSSGEPDFKSPRNAIEAAYKAALAGDTKYPPQDGTRALKEAVQRKFKRENNLDYAYDEIMLCGGVPVSVSCLENNQFKLRLVFHDAATTEKTKWVVLNFPNNPTGA